MREEKGNLWTYPDADAICVTTNGQTKRNGDAVMGRGTALQAKQRFPGIEKTLGEQLRRSGNVPAILYSWPVAHTNRRTALLSFPVKHLWAQPADPDLIVQSARLLVELADRREWKTVVLPRPGCGNGQLRWEDVGPMIAPLLDDRFVVLER